MDIIPETINRIRLNDAELILLGKILKKININDLDQNERKFFEILSQRVEGRLKLKEK